MKTRFLIIGSIGVVVGLLMFYFGVILIEEDREYHSSLPTAEYDPDVSSIRPMQYFDYMPLLGIPISLTSSTVIAYGFFKWKYGYVYVPLISAFLVVMWFAFLLSRGS